MTMVDTPKSMWTLSSAWGMFHIHSVSSVPAFTKLSFNYNINSLNVWHFTGSKLTWRQMFSYLSRPHVRQMNLRWWIMSNIT